MEKLTPKFKKPVKVPTRSEKLFINWNPAAASYLEQLVDFSGYKKAEIIEHLINDCFHAFKYAIEIKAPAMIGARNFINPKKYIKMTSKPQTHLFNPDGSQASDKLIFTNFSTMEKSYFDTLEQAEQEIKAGAVTGYIYNETTRRQRFYTNGVLSNEKQF